MRKLYTVPLSVVLFAIFSGICHSQSDNGVLTVTLADQAGNIVLGATVTVRRPDRSELVLQTNENGATVFRGLGPGEYRVMAAVAGFRDHNSEPVLLRAGEHKTITIALELGVIESQVSVNENEALDPDRDGSTRDLEQEQIENLPADPEELKRVLQAIAGRTADGSEMPITVDGMPGGQMPSKENIKLVRINRNVFSAEYENTYGGGIFIYTNSNAKRITGYAQIGYGNSRINASDPFIGRRTPFNSTNFFYGMSVPFGKKVSLFVNGSYFRADSSSVVKATIVGPEFQIVDYRHSVDVPSRSGGYDMTMNADPNKKHKLVITYRMRRGHTRNSVPGGLTLPESAINTTSSDDSFSFSDTYIINPDLINVTRFKSWFTNNSWRGDITRPSIRVSDAFVGGGSQTDREASHLNYEIYNDTTRKVSRFSVGFGVMVRGSRLSETSRSDFGGTYTFSGRVAPVLNSNYEPVRDTEGNIITEQISSIESYRRTLLLRQLGFSPTEVRFLGGGADQLSIAGGDPYISVSHTDYAFYQQNSYGISETIGVSFGLRYENETNIVSRVNLAPRFGFIWSPKAGDKQKPIATLPRVTVGVGVFYSRFGINNILSERQANDPDRDFYFITDPAILDLYPLVPSTENLQQSAALRSLRLIDNGIQTPRSNILNFSLTKRLWMDFSLNVSTYHLRGFRRAVVRNTNAPFAGSGMFPLGNSRSVHETRSEGRMDVDRYNASLNFPQLKISGKPIYASFSYTFAKSRGNVASGSSSPIDPYDFSGEWGPDTQDGEHSVWGYFGIPLPNDFFFRGDLSYRTGARFNIITGRDTNKDGFYSERPAYASDPNKPGVIQTPFGLLDPNPGPSDRIIPRNLARGPRGAGLNIYISKSFGFNPDKANKNTPRQRLHFGVSINNVLNINNKGVPIGNMSSPYFLQSINRGSEGNYNFSSPRRFNFNTSFSF